ncbi:MAG: hypothetical protein K0R43_1675 [Pseudoduganella sp.]|jgi:hypothetical protein|nr:hypothetical protein [Pseudoduganella sp.]
METELMEQPARAAPVHTEGRLIVGTLNDGLIGTHHCAMEESGAKAIALTGMVGEPDDALSRGNAHRIAACWNACQGLTMDHFDGGWTAKGLSRHAKALENQIATARTLLSDALETFDDNLDQDHEVADRIRAFLKGGAA